MSITLRLGCGIARWCIGSLLGTRAASAMMIRGTVAAKPTLEKWDLSRLKADLANIIPVVEL